MGDHKTNMCENHSQREKDQTEMWKMKMCLRGSDNYVASSSLHIKIKRDDTSLARLVKVKKSTCMINQQYIHQRKQNKKKLVCKIIGGLKEVVTVIDIFMFMKNKDKISKQQSQKSNIRPKSWNLQHLTCWNH